ncbi:hypothetical protein DLD82_12770 [Methanospirillum stamsii]|uniref:Uncharacterized protein n=2 Tax=Methanospirillum stamsii TaxID=1277351 RepID=A0A2V2N6M4_9EURY|nr:hypothetical protein DLD82_12770 [Methanospirillum stamsii]
MILLFLTLFSVSGLTDNSGIDVNTTVQAFQDTGFSVGLGKMQTVDAIGLYDAGITPSCYAINPSAPYMSFKVPKAPGQTSNNTISDSPINPENKGLWLDYHTRPDEAFVYIGTTPPECDYFSYCGYLATRYFPLSNEKRRVYASLGDAISLSRLKDEPAYNSGVFSKPIIIIFTADMNTDTKARTALTAVGYPEDIIHTLVVPHTLVNLGLDSETDTLTTLHRVALFRNEEEGDAYMNSTPGTVYRLTPETEEEPAFFDVPDVIPRGTGDTREMDLMDDLEELRQAIIDRNEGYEVQDLTTKIWIFEGYDAIQRGIDALGDIRDTVYLNTTNTVLGDKPGECIMVYGVNHVATKKATYANFGLYGLAALNGIEGISNHDYTGTAEEYLPGNPNAQYLYVAKICREDDGSPSTSVIPSGVGAHGVEPDEPCFVGFRVYVEPETSVGPAWNEIVYDRAIKITP